MNKKKLIDKNYAGRAALQEHLNSIGVSRRHLTELFEKRYGMSPEQYINLVRFSQAKELLADGKKITEVVFDHDFLSSGRGEK